MEFLKYFRIHQKTPGTPGSIVMTPFQGFGS